MTPEEERAHLLDQLRQAAEGAAHEWMRMPILTDVADIEHQVRVRWQAEPNVFMCGPIDGTGEEYGRFKLHVTIEALPPLPPIGQDADLERMGREMAEAPESADERPVHWGDDNRTACGKWSGMVYAYASDSRQVTCPECLEAGNNQLIWHPRTMKDARRGDQIRPAGSDLPNGTAVTDRLLPPDPDGQDRGTRHVVPGAKHWDDHVVQPGEVWLCLDGGAPRNVNPDFPIEILLTRAEIAAIELLGWDNRKSLTSE